MSLAARSRSPKARRWGLRVAVAAGVLLLFALGVGAPAWGSDAKGPHRLIFDAAATPSWWYLYHGPGTSYDMAMDVAITKGGVTYVAGSVGEDAGTDASLIKLVDGVAAWPAPKTYDSPYHSVDMATDDRARARQHRLHGGAIHRRERRVRHPFGEVVLSRSGAMGAALRWSRARSRPGDGAGGGLRRQRDRGRHRRGTARTGTGS